MPPGMKINFDEQNMTEWEVLLDGPEQSVYTVRAETMATSDSVSEKLLTIF
jgi:ubiquitin-protein ligase